MKFCKFAICKTGFEKCLQIFQLMLWSAAMY
jgi:hypothetical protein